MVIAKRDPQVLMSPHYVAERRTTRRPQHRFNLRFLPYEIQPFLLAPVLPGETFDSIMVQSQTWSDPLKPTLKNVGWWLHYNFFYVRHRDLPKDVRDLLAAMMLDPGTDMSAVKANAQSWPFYTFNGGMDWTRLCLEHVVSEYFRDDGEDWDDFVSSSGLPLAQIYGRGSSDGVEKLTLADDYEDRRVDLIDQDGHLYANTINPLMAHYMAMRDAGLTDMDYQDFMKTYGSTVREDEESPNLHRAEDIWSLREFTYPSNTVEGATGVPAVAAGWRMAKSGGKRVFCDEPGFIFGVTYVRPKVYLRNLRGSLAGAMADVHSWLPAMLHDQVDLGHVSFAANAGPVPNVFEDGASSPSPYWIDIRDLLLYGDQFINFDPASASPFLSLPAVDGRRRYAATEELRSFFSTAFASTGVFETDGLASLQIRGRQRNTTSGLVLGKA